MNALIRSSLPLVLLALCAISPTLLSQSPTRPPNVVLFMADDMGLGDTSAYQDITGNTNAEQVSTPSMDRLARMGVRLTDAHSSGSRCTPTRYGLLTGRYPWRSRMKYWVLFGAQGDPLIEPDRPTIGTLLQDQGYITAMVGKWHLGLRYRRSDGGPAAGWSDADLSQPLLDSPLDHGFDYFWGLSRSHPTSGAWAGTDRNRPNQSTGPGHLVGRRAISHTGPGKKLADSGENAFILEDLGDRQFQRAVAFLEDHVENPSSSERPFFLYYASPSNHTPHTPDDEVNGEPVRGASRNVVGDPMNQRADFIYENDVALGGLLDFLSERDDPRDPDSKLIDNTLVIFTSDNGAETPGKFATGPWRSNKGSSYEGGHRVPFLVAWPNGGIGASSSETSSQGETVSTLFGLHDVFATLAEIVDADLPDLRAGRIGAEDSLSALAAWRGEPTTRVEPMLINDHKESETPAVASLRIDDPVFSDTVWRGQWKLFVGADGIRLGNGAPIELYDLKTDAREANNLIDREEFSALTRGALDRFHELRRIGGHRYQTLDSKPRVEWRWTSEESPIGELVSVRDSGVIEGAIESMGAPTDENWFENGAGLAIRFDRDVLVESVALRAGESGASGGFYQMGARAPAAVYCVDDDDDSRDQSGRLSDLGVLLKGQTLILNSGAFLGVEEPGRWRLESLAVRPL